MANNAKTSVYRFSLAAAALVGAQACAHQMEEELIDADGDAVTGRGGTSASSGDKGGSAGTIGALPPATAGKGGTSASSGGKGGSAGSGGTSDSAGTSGSGGTGGSGGSAGSEGGGQPAPDTGFVVQYMTGTTEATSTAISCQLAIRNDSNMTVPISELTLRYYFTNELLVEPILESYWSHFTSGEPFTFTITQVVIEGAKAYFEFKLAGDVMLAPNQTAELAWQSRNNDNQVNLQTNDYSFDATKTQYTIWDHVELLRNGEPYWGTPP